MTDNVEISAILKTIGLENPSSKLVVGKTCEIVFETQSSEDAAPRKSTVWASITGMYHAAKAGTITLSFSENGHGIDTATSGDSGAWYIDHGVGATIQIVA